MSFTHVLELDSQAELLERLKLLTNFGSNLIAINGGAGYGKTWLAQRYLEVGASNKNQCLLLCHRNQDDPQRRILILSQLVSDALFNQHEPLLDTLERILDGEPCEIVIVVDDAQLLSDSLISELWALVLQAQQKSHWAINVLLFTQAGHLEGILSRLSYGQAIKPMELDIDLLSEVEARHFFESLVVRYVEERSEKRVRDAFKKVDPIPGAIMALGDMKVEKRIIIRSIVAKPLNLVLAILGLVLLAVGGYWWLFSQPNPDDKAQQITRTVEQTAIPTLSEPNNNDISLTSVTGESTSSVYSDAVDDSDSLPPPVTNEVATVGVDDNNQRVVIESEVVDALLEDKPEQTENSQVEEDIDTSILGASTQVDSNAISTGEAESNDSTVTQDSGLQSDLSKPIVKFSFAREELQTLSPRAYTLQLAAATSIDDVQDFLDKHQLNNQVRIYPTLRSGTEWYIVTYRDYPTIQQARDAIETLPASLKSLGPWAKSLGQVQREIERAK